MRPLTLPLVDDFGDELGRGRVIGSTSTSGHRRVGADDEGTLSIDGGALRVTPLVRPGWARSTIGYGPFRLTDGLVASVVVTNGRNGSDDLDPWPSPLGWLAQWLRGTQSDAPFRHLARRLVAGGRDGVLRGARAAVQQRRVEPDERSGLNLAFGWSPSPRGGDPAGARSMVVRSTGPDNAELCVTDRGALVPVQPLAEVPMRLVLVCTTIPVVQLAALDDGTGRWPVAEVLGSEPIGIERPVWLTLQQRVLGQAGWRMDTRVREVRVARLADVPSRDDLVAHGIGGSDAPSALRDQRDSSVVHADRFDGVGDLDGRRVGQATWSHVIGRRRIVIRDGSAQVGDLVPAPAGRLARLRRPSGQRTAYVLPWPGGAGSIESEIVPPGTGPGQAQRGRGGLILYEDDDNHLIFNDWLDDEYGGASVSVFRRADGVEDVYSAVWVNVGSRVRWGRAHRLRLAFDDAGFTASLDDDAVLTREFTDLTPVRRHLDVRAVGICSNWEFGDDTGSAFRGFTARRSGR